MEEKEYLDLSVHEMNQRIFGVYLSWTGSWPESTGNGRKD